MDKNKSCSSRLGTVGGQAVMEGIMMKSKDLVALSVRSTDGKIKTEVNPFKTVRDKYKILNIPVLRGIINFVETMILSFKTLNRSLDLLGIEEEESKFEKWLTEKFGKSITSVVSAIGTVLGLILSVFLFIYLPTQITEFLKVITQNRFILSLTEGLLKILIFVLYIYLCSLIPDMKRVFQYHGAEHKTIFCHESGNELTYENVQKFKRFHPRCGTSFLFVMMFIGILFSVLVIHLPVIVRVPIKILFLPLIVGVGFEFIKFAGKSNSLIMRILSAPGLWVQRLTTKEPDESQIEVAITALKAALPDIYPNDLKEQENTDTQK